MSELAELQKRLSLGPVEFDAARGTRSGTRLVLFPDKETFHAVNSALADLGLEVDRDIPFDPSLLAPAYGDRAEPYTTASHHRG